MQLCYCKGLYAIGICARASLGTLYLFFYDIYLYILGVFWKFDNIVAPPNEQPSFFAKVRQYIPWRSPTSAELSEVQEFTLCLRAFLPARDFQSFQMDARNSFIRVLITKLCQMEFSRSNHYTPKLFCHFSFEDNFKVFYLLF